MAWTALVPPYVLQGRVWQLVTYSFVHQGILNTAFELLSLWFLSSFLESNHGSRWLGEIYFASVLGAGLALCCSQMDCQRLFRKGLSGRSVLRCKDRAEAQAGRRRLRCGRLG